MQSELHGRLMPAIKPRAEPDQPFGRSTEDDSNDIPHSSAGAGKFYHSQVKERFTADNGDRVLSSLDSLERGFNAAGGGSLTRTAKRQRPDRLIEADAGYAGRSDLSRRFFQEEDNGMISNGMSHRRQRRKFAQAAASNMMRPAFQGLREGDYSDDRSIGTQAATDAGWLAESGSRDLISRSAGRLRMRRAEQFRQAYVLNEGLIFDGADQAGEVMRSVGAVDSKHRNRIRRYYHKQRYKRMYAERRYLEMKDKAAFSGRVRMSTRIKAALSQLISTKKRTVIILGIIALMCFMMMAAISSCAASIHGLTSSLLATTYPSTDEDIHAVEDAYSAMEAKLNAQIARIEMTHPGYDDYMYQVDEISHNPYHLISYFTTKYGEFTYEQVKDELSEIFHEQYSISTSTGSHKVTETVTQMVEGEEVETEETKTVKTLNIVMTNHDLDNVLRARLNSDEQGQYRILNTTYGNRDYLFDLDSLPAYSPGGLGQSYQIPPEALTDKRFARMIKEANKYLGYPYVWGGSSPSTSFDCSGFVCWVINHCGNGWNIGRVDAGVLCRNICARVSPSNAKPGDLIFFQHTYNTSGVSHVGIYVGNGMMIHCGNPIQYTSVKSAYWQQHFLCYGRIR